MEHGRIMVYVHIYIYMCVCTYIAIRSLRYSVYIYTLLVARDDTKTWSLYNVKRIDSVKINSACMDFVCVSI